MGRGSVGGRNLRQITSLLAALVLAASLLTAGFADSVTAATRAFGFWQFDGCNYIWSGSAQGWTPGVCGRADHVAWGRGAAAHQAYHWNGNGWDFQGIYSGGTMDTPNGIFIVPFISDGQDDIFVYDYADKLWYHIRLVKQSVQAVPNPTLPPPEVETTSGWRSITEVGDPALGTMVREWQDLQDDIIWRF